MLSAFHAMGDVLQLAWFWVLLLTAVATPVLIFSGLLF
jgi:hypothetical protein